MKYSYAQNFEDAILWRLFSSVKKGFYIDVGANHPTSDSVTKVFYDAGWRGINFEPIEKFHSLLMDVRTRDLNLRKCVSDVDDELVELLDVVGTGLSTVMVEREGQLSKDFEVEKVVIETVTLNTVLKAESVEQIHFLKIDVEGMESNVLRGIDLGLYRPWVIVVESLDPSTHEEDYEDWEPTILQSDYEFVYWDGLNRFYVAQEHIGLLNGADVYPPNISDELVKGVMHIRNGYEIHLNRIAELKGEVENLTQVEARMSDSLESCHASISDLDLKNRSLTQENSALKHKNSDLAQKNNELTQTNNELTQMNNELSREVYETTIRLFDITNSGLWKLTLPYRYSASKLRVLMRQFKLVIFSLKNYGLIETLAKIGSKVGAPFRNAGENGSETASLPISLANPNLTKREQQIYSHLVDHRMD